MGRLDSGYGLGDRVGALATRPAIRATYWMNCGFHFGVVRQFDNLLCSAFGVVVVRTVKSEERSPVMRMRLSLLRISSRSQCRTALIC